MDELELQSILETEITTALGFDDFLSSERIRLQEYYEGVRPHGNKIRDRSQVINRSVLEVVHWLLPELARVLLSGEKVISFEPRTPQDVELAKQVTDYVAFVLAEQEFFKVGYCWIKSALILKTGFTKASFEPQTIISMNSFTGLSDDELHALMSELGNADKYEVVEQNDYPDPDFVPPPVPQGMLAQRSPNAPQGASQPFPIPGAPPGTPPQPIPPEAYQPKMLHDIRCRIYDTDGRVVIRHVLPEEILIGRRCPETRFTGDHFVGHRMAKTISDLRQMGYDEEKIQQAKGSDEPEYSQERLTRFQKDDLFQLNERTDEAMQTVWVCECFLKVDYNDDGIAELRKIVTAGDGAVIFENEECDEVPIIPITAIIEPGRAIGTSIAELVVDISEATTALQRGLLDSLYLSLVPRNVINVNKLTEDTIDDLSEGSPASLIRVNDDGCVTPLDVSFVGQQAIPVLEYFNQAIQTRTGVGPQNNIVSPEVLNNQTAAGISMQQSAASAQIELMIRVMAQSFKELARQVLGLLVRHQQKPRIIRLNDKFVEMDPRYWHENFDIEINVGVGTGNQEKTSRDLAGVLQIMQPIIQGQGSLQGPYVTAEDLHNVLSKLTSCMGYKDDFFPHLAKPDPSAMQGGMQKPDPEVEKQHAMIQVAQAKAQNDMELSKQRASLDAQLAQAHADLELRLSQDKHNSELQMEQERARNQMEIELMRERHKQEMQQQQLQAQLAMDMTP